MRRWGRANAESAIASRFQGSTETITYAREWAFQGRSRSRPIQSVKESAAIEPEFVAKARGIDLPSLSLVIHLEMPRDAQSLQHPLGRTGHAGL